MATEPIQVDFDEVLERCTEWEFGEIAELRELGMIIQCAYIDDELESVEMLCQALLDHDDLPAFYKAKMYAYLSTCEGYNTDSYLSIATAWIFEAKAQEVHLGYISEDIYTWEEIIENHKRKIAEQARPTVQLPHRPQRGLALGMSERAEEVSPGQATAMANEAYEEAKAAENASAEARTVAEKEAEKMAQEAQKSEVARAEDSEEQRRRHRHG